MTISGKRIYIFGKDVTRIVKSLEKDGQIVRTRIPANSPFGPHIKRTRLRNVADIEEQRKADLVNAVMQRSDVELEADSCSGGV